MIEAVNALAAEVHFVRLALQAQGSILELSLTSIRDSFERLIRGIEPK